MKKILEKTGLAVLDVMTVPMAPPMGLATGIGMAFARQNFELPDLHDKAEWESRVCAYTSCAIMIPFYTIGYGIGKIIPYRFTNRGYFDNY